MDASDASAYPTVRQYIAGQWRAGGQGVAAEVRNPATGQVLAEVPRASTQDLDDALAAAASAFDVWRLKSPQERAAVQVHHQAGLLAALGAVQPGRQRPCARGDPQLTDRAHLRPCAQGAAAGADHFAGLRGAARRQRGSASRAHGLQHFLNNRMKRHGSVRELGRGPSTRRVNTECHPTE